MGFRSKIRSTLWVSAACIAAILALADTASALKREESAVGASVRGLKKSSSSSSSSMKSGGGKSLKKKGGMSVKMAKSGKSMKGRDVDPMEILAMATDAIGGADALVGLESLQVEATGASWVMFETGDPEEVTPATTYERTYAHDLLMDNHRVDEVTVPFFEIFSTFPPQAFSRIINGNVGGLTVQALFNAPGTIPSQHVAALKRQFMLFHPHLILLQAWMQPDLLLGGTYTKGYYVLEIGNSVSPIHLYVDSDTGIISKLHTMESNPLVRDVHIEIDYTDWAMDENGLLMFPLQIDMYSLMGQIWYESRSSVAVNSIADGTDFSLPVGTDMDSYNALLYEFGTQAAHVEEPFFHAGFPYFPFTATLDGPIQVTPGVDYYIAPGGSNLMVIQHQDGLVLLECSLSELQGDNILSTIESQYPGQDVTLIIQSHHHVDHAAGVRQVVGTLGAPLVVGHGVARFWKDVFEAESMIRPDVISQMEYDFDLTLRTVRKNGRRVLINEDNMLVTVYHTDSSPHAYDMIITVVETNGMRVIYQGDLYNGGVGLTAVIEGPLTFYDLMRDLGFIDEDCVSPDMPLVIVSAHGGALTLEQSLAELAGLGVDVGCP